MQLKILDRLEKQSSQIELVQSLREQLLEEKQQGILLSSSIENLDQQSHLQILPSAPSEIRIEEKIKRIVEEQSMEMTTDAEELYRELQKMRVSIETAFDNVTVQEEIKERPVSFDFSVFVNLRDSS